MNKRRPSKSRLTRDKALFVVGLGGIIHETVRVQVDRPYLLMLFAYMTGLPIVAPLFSKVQEKLSSNETSTDEARR